ncbi:MAG: hypothetical protein GX262_10905 [Clostridia bacterium]|nr:hypothetical protein [Clostridia bacterium]
MLKFLWQNEDGIVLPLAVVLIAVLTLLGFSAIFMVDAQKSLAQKDIEKADALHYAEAGIHDYLGHVNRKTNKDWDRWGEVIPFEDGYYQVVKVDYDEKSLKRDIQSTGWVAGDEDNKRTVQVTIDRRAFNQYAYFSNTDSFIINGKKEKVYWAKNEKCYGPYHTNDSLYIKDANSSSRPVFYGHVSYVNAIEGDYVKSYAKQLFREGYSKVPPIVIPQTNYQIKERAQEGGHYYSGRTRILLDGDKYHVKYYEYDEKGKKYVEKEKRNLPLPENGVIYVDGGSDGKFAATSGNLFIAGELSGSLTIGAANEIYITGYDPLEDTWATKNGKNWTIVPAKKPNNTTQGLVYKNTTFQQVKKGNEVVGYTANLNKGDDLLGLVANKDIKILGIGWFNNPNPSSGSRNSDPDPEYNVAPTDITIHGAIFSIGEGFGFEAYDIHKKGTIILRGSIIQNSRKAVGLTDGSKGYKKDYAHDPRMLNATPPGFPEPLNTGWEIKSWKEVNPNTN